MKKVLAVVALATIFMMVLVGCQQKVESDTAVEMQSEPTETMEAKVAYVDVTPMEAKELMETRDDLVVLDVSPK